VNKTFSNLVVLLLVSVPVAAMEDAKTVAKLEEAGALQTAYPFALRLTDQQNSEYANWRRIAKKYETVDQSEGGTAYLKAWQQAERDPTNIDQYRDFAALRPKTNLSALAVHRIFQSIDADRDKCPRLCPFHPRLP
jgi:hypothetical protein